MNFLALFPLLVFVYVTHGLKQESSCTVNKNCREDSCCAYPDQRRGRREIISSLQRIAGTCQAFKLPGSSCLVNNVAGSKVVSHKGECPCAPGLKCIGLGVFEVPQGERGICSSATCSTNSQCPRGTCCVLPDNRRGKRSVLGQCKALGKSGSSCFPGRDPLSKTHLGICPCGSGLQCEPTGVRVVPQGELGKCS